MLSVSVTITVPSSAPTELLERVERMAVELGDAGGIDQVLLEIVRTCFVCGCTDDEACLGGCSWVELVDAGDDRDLCSSCAEAMST